MRLRFEVTIQDIPKRLMSKRLQKELLGDVAGAVAAHEKVEGNIVTEELVEIITGD